MFFKPQLWEKGNEKISLPINASVTGFDGYALTLIQKWIADFGKGESDLAIEAKKDDTLPAEGYSITLDKNRISVRYADTRAEIYAAVTLRQMSESDELYAGVLTDSPDCEFRGYRVFLPGRKSFKEFFDMVDFIVEYKYNYISLEVGGAMEYKRHPEINEKWAEFAKETHRYSGRTHEIQKGYAWEKNSIHTDNGDGDILTQDEVRQLIAYCRERGLEVYPEVPTLSHCDYLVMAHPEIAERKEDPYPDTYCPSNPRSYELTFDILEEVIDVFQPKLINIGHDEFYSMCVCEKCRKKRPQDVYTEDVKKIHAFLTERGIKCAMWCEKLLPCVTKDGHTYGGAGMDYLNERGERIIVPPTFQCQHMLPRDIIMINWYYGFGMQYDIMLHMHGYPMIFGNMSVKSIENWRMRRNFGLKGGSCSNWGSNDPEYMQRNCQYMNLVMSAYAMWSRDYDSNGLEELMTSTFRECYRKHFGNLDGYIEVTHTTEKYIPYKVFYDGVFIEDELYRMGKYLLTYTDGTTAEFDVKYGTNIATDRLMKLSEREKDPAVGVGESSMCELCYSAIPFEEKGRTFFRTAFKNPHPEKPVKTFEYIPENGDVELMSVTFHR